MERPATDLTLRICRLDKRTRQSRRIGAPALRVGNPRGVYTSSTATCARIHETIRDCRGRLDADVTQSKLDYRRKVVYLKSQPSMWLIADAKCVRRGWVFEDRFAAIMWPSS